VAQCWKGRSRECRRWNLEVEEEEEPGDATFAFCFFLLFSTRRCQALARATFASRSQRLQGADLTEPFSFLFFHPSFETRRFLSSDEGEKNVPPWVLA